MPDPTPSPLEPLLAQLAASLEDQRLGDDEKRDLGAALRAAGAQEDGLRQLRNRAFALARERLRGHDGEGLLQWLDGVVRALDVARAPAGTLHARAFFSPGEDCLDAIRQQLRAARRSIDLCVFTISDDRITREILAAHQRGVALRLITDNEKESDAGSDIAQLRQAGIPTAVDRTPAHMHHKYALFDGSWLLNGSYNWTRSACECNEENLVLSNDPALLRPFSAHFQALWQQLQGPPPGR
jgi:cardiolipin hydrolase